MQYYIFTSDPHGRGKPWIDLVKQAQSKYPNARLVFGGDYIDGRKDSKMNLDFIMQQVKENNAVALLGNHEQLMLDYLDGKDSLDWNNESLWFINGGKSTVRSIMIPLFHRGFSAQKSANLIKHSTPYYNFLKHLPLLYEAENIIFVHAGVNPTTKNYLTNGSYKDANDKEQYFLWARNEYFFKENSIGLDLKTTNMTGVFNHNLTGKTIVTGHTPTCLIEGKYDESNDNKKVPALPLTQCPVRVIQYPNEPARIFTDNGCHTKMAKHKGNVVVLDGTGKIIEIFN